MLILVWANVAYSKDSDCNWNDDIPCITIYPNIKPTNAPIAIPNAWFCALLSIKAPIKAPIKGPRINPIGVKNKPTKTPNIVP